jgi:hypothetical protein
MVLRPVGEGAAGADDGEVRGLVASAGGRRHGERQAQGKVAKGLRALGVITVRSDENVD